MKQIKIAANQSELDLFMELIQLNRISQKLISLSKNESNLNLIKVNQISPVSGTYPIFRAKCESETELNPNGIGLSRK